MLKHSGSSPTLREYLDKITRLKRAKSSKGEKSPVTKEQEEAFDMKFLVQTLSTKFEKMREMMAQIGKEAQEYYRLSSLISEFDHLLRRLTEKINQPQENKNNNFLKPQETAPKSPKIKMKLPPSLKFEPAATIQLKQIKQQVPEQFFESYLKVSQFAKEKSSLISTKSKDVSSDILTIPPNPEVSALEKKRAALKLNLENISSKRFFKGKIQRMDSIGSTQIQNGLGATLLSPIKK